MHQFFTPCTISYQMFSVSHKHPFININFLHINLIGCQRQQHKKNFPIIQSMSFADTKAIRQYKSEGIPQHQINFYI